MENKKIKEIESFWNVHICGAHFIKEPFGTKKFFEAYSNFRYSKEWHLNELVPFEKF